MIGSVVATIVIGQIGTSPEAKLVGAVVGAAIPGVAAYVLPRRNLHLGVGIALTVIALVLVYGGSVAINAAADRPQTFPTWVKDPTPTATVTATATADPGGPGISVSPQVLSCTPQCAEPVSITSNGERPLRIGTVSISDDAENRFSKVQDCAGVDLDPGEKCEFGIAFSAPQDADTRTASMRVESNAGAATMQLEGRSAATAVDLVPGQDTKCNLDGQQLTVLGLAVALAGQFDGPVKVTATVTAPAFDPEIKNSGDAQVGGDAVELTLALPQPADAVEVIVGVDSTGAVTEEKEDNNAVKLTCT